MARSKERRSATAARRDGAWRRIARWCMAALVLVALVLVALLAGPALAKPAADTTAELARAQELVRLLDGKGTPAQLLAAALEWSRLASLLPHRFAASATDAALAKPTRDVPGRWAREILLQVRTDLGAAPLPDPGAALHWAWLGPFGDEHGTALPRNGALETAIESTPGPLPAAAPGRSGEVRWQRPPAGMVRVGEPTPLEELLDRPDDAEVYVATWLRPISGEPAKAQLRLWVQGPARVWLGTHALAPVAAKPESTGMPDETAATPAVDELPVALAGGWQRVVVKLGPAGAHVGFGLRVVDPGGLPLAIESTATCPAEVVDPVPEAPTKGDSKVFGLSWPPDKPMPADVAAALLQLDWHGWPIPESLHEQLSSMAPEELPSSSEVALAHANLSGEPGDRAELLDRWQQLRPDDEVILAARAAALDEIGHADQGHRLWVSWSIAHQRQPEHRSTAACRARVTLWRRLSGDLAARRLLDACRRQWPEVPALQADWARQLESSEDEAAAVAVYRTLAEQTPRPEAKARLAVALIQAGKLAEAAAMLEDFRLHYPGHTRPLEHLARAWLDEGQLDQAEAWLQRVPAPQRRTQWLDFAARLALRRGQSDVAQRHLRQAAAMAPQRADLRARLQRLSKGADTLSSHHRDLLALAQSERGKARSVPLEVRFRQIVLQALGNGQQARREAELTYLGPNCNGTHTVAIDYAPDLSQADVLQAMVVRADGRIDRNVAQSVDRYTQDDSGMYFDLERISLTFKNLRPGDAIVVEYEVRDLGPAPFGLVFGELLQLADVAPVRQTEVAVQLPGDMPLHFALYDPLHPDAPPAKPETSLVGRADEGGPWRQWQWQIGALPALPSDADAPGDTELGRYLHLSSMESWRDAARWYGDVLGQALPKPGQDAVIRDLARKLTAGKTDRLSKIKAVYEYARSQVRYVGLEFGIHSLKPHAPREVVLRQFGDCKDKAALIVALLAEVDIAAQVALVRTSEGGKLADGVASLGVFNHAIAYVDDEELWLDATANLNDMNELPGGDAGGMALRIGDGAPGKLEELPELQLEREHEQREVSWQLRPDGGAELQWHAEVRGAVAAEVRARLTAAATRKERVEQDLAARWPGLAVAKLGAQGIDPIEATVRLEASGSVPKLGQVRDGRWTMAPLRPGQSWSTSLANEQTRKADVVLPRPVALAEVVRVQAPPGWRHEPRVAVQMLQSKVGKLRLQSHVEGDVLVLEVDLNVAPRRITVADYPALRKFVAQVDDALGQEFALVRVTAGGTP